MRRGTTCLLIGVSGCLACGGSHALTAGEYRARATRICTDGRGTHDARPRWREFARLRAPAALAGGHRAVVHLQRRRLTADRREAEVALDVVSNGATSSPRYRRFALEADSLRRAQRSALRRLGLPVSCAVLADDAVTGPPPSPKELRRIHEELRRLVPGL